jgi:hypothetical protein
MPTSLTIGRQYLAGLGALLFVALLPQIARAALGGPEASIAEEAQQLKVSVKSTPRANYRLHELQMSSGTVLREFADTGGTVFAVAWSGPTIPNLRQALGQYFAAYVSAAQGKRAGGHTHLEIRQTDWVMQSNGHMRSFQGRAYLPQALPAGVTLDEIH